MNDLRKTKTDWVPKAGEGCVNKVTGEQYIIRALIQVGEWANNSQNPNDYEDEIVALEIKTADGHVFEIPLSWVRQETFNEYLLRPTGVGRTPWIFVFITALMFIFGHTLCIITWFEGGWIITLLLFLIKGGIMWSLWKNYKNINQ